jgi:Zn ribbon nucleic-acid-binding protein
VQTCSLCNTQSPDTSAVCPQCQADLKKFAVSVVTLKRFQANSRVIAVRLAVSGDCCPACREQEGTYAKDQVPSLPSLGCSHKNGCRCFYEPVLSEIYP